MSSTCTRLLARTCGWTLAAIFVTSTSIAKPCAGLPTEGQLSAILTEVVRDGNGGLFKPNAMWATIVDRTGVVCAVARVGDAWPGSRVISAQKASTANAFSNDRLALSTANLYSAVQPGGSLYGLQFSNPVDTGVAYRGNGAAYGTASDPMVGGRIGGVNVFGGGLALYQVKTQVLGALGVSGDSSCADHIIAWRIREKLQLDKIPGGVSPAADDNIIHDIAGGLSKGGFGHPVCSPATQKIDSDLKLGK